MADTKIRAQVIVEFIMSFTCLMIIMVLTSVIFVWYGQSFVRRHKAYEGSRTILRDVDNKVVLPAVDFYRQEGSPQAVGPLKIFKD